jgi:ribonucleoside-triphosphate reductase
MDKVVKRDGKLVEFNSEKITNAIEKAGIATKEFDKNTAKTLTQKVMQLAQEMMKGKKQNLKASSIEEIQDMVEYVLLSSDYKKNSKVLCNLPNHTKLREFANNANVSMVDDYLKKLDWQVSENSNMSYSIQGLNNYVSSSISKGYWLNKIYPTEVRDAHLQGDIHIHDLNMISVYCVGWDLKDLLLEGFTGVKANSISLAKHFRVHSGNFHFLHYAGGNRWCAAFSNLRHLLRLL